jgi:hypothetical protein
MEVDKTGILENFSGSWNTGLGNLGLPHLADTHALVLEAS